MRMLNNRIKMILIGLSVILCSIVFVITLYYLYHRYRQKHRLSLNEINKSKEENNSPKILEELMRKSLELAKTAEKVADKNQKRFPIEDHF